MLRASLLLGSRTLYAGHLAPVTPLRKDIPNKNTRVEWTVLGVDSRDLCNASGERGEGRADGEAERVGKREATSGV